jgi:hypothetical protein
MRATTVSALGTAARGRGGRGGANDGFRGTFAFVAFGRCEPVRAA